MSMAAMKTSQARQKSGKREAEEELFGKFSDGKQQKRIEKGLSMTEHLPTLNDRCFFMRANLSFCWPGRNDAQQTTREGVLDAVGPIRLIFMLFEPI